MVDSLSPTWDTDVEPINFRNLQQLVLGTRYNLDTISNIISVIVVPVKQSFRRADSGRKDPSYSVCHFTFKLFLRHGLWGVQETIISKFGFTKKQISLRIFLPRRVRGPTLQILGCLPSPCCKRSYHFFRCRIFHRCRYFPDFFRVLREMPTSWRHHFL